MLDKKTEQMLRVASVLTAEDLDEIHGCTAIQSPPVNEAEAAEEVDQASPAEETESRSALDADLSRGQRERMRTRESKVSTACVGKSREPHAWWPVGTELVGQIGSETFTATVIENPQVKSGRSVMITCWPAQGQVCLTPTRAAIEATEAYRQTQGLGRGGGVTNGWSFWKPKQ